MVEKIGALPLFLNKIELWDCKGFLLSDFEVEIRERLGLRPDAGIRGPMRWFRKGRREREKSFRETECSARARTPHSRTAGPEQAPHRHLFVP